MKQFLQSVAGALATTAWLCAGASAAQLPSRIAGQINTSEQVEIAGTATHRPATSTVVGHLPGNTPLTRMGLVLAPSAAQQADLDQLLADQVNPASARYHRWLTPAQFGARFGVSDADLAKIEGWLISQGFDIVSVPASRNTVFFSGTSAAVESAFGVSMQQYRRGGQDFFENSGNIKVPAALSGVVRGVTSLSSYRLRSNLVRRATASAATKPQYTQSDGATHEITPWDFRQIYGLNTLANAGYNGQVKIAVVGQSGIDTTQIGYFQQLTGQTAKTPTLVLVPGSGASTNVPGDESESEIDIEYSGGTALGASVQFVYTGNSSNNGVFDSVAYAVTQDLAPIITMSYGGCETDYTTYANQTFEPYLQQANAQGQTVLVSAGDEDAATCDVVDSSTGSATIASGGATVSYPASSPYVTAVGGTRFSEGTGTYWNSTNNSFGGSATGYIPEIVWNETSDPGNINSGPGGVGYAIVGTGGGASALFGKPSWQTGTGVPGDGQRDLPDVAFNAAIYNDPYVFCSADTIAGAGAYACTTSTFGGYVGGTSLSAPNFAAMLAIVEQKNSVTAGLGNINPSIYSLAAGSSASAVFNDVTSGNNVVPCIVGTPDCTSGTLGFVAGVGYDQTTGWGSVNGAAFATALAAQPSSSTATPTLTVSANPAAPIINNAVILTATVASASSTTVPTGTVQFTIDGASAGSQTLSSGSAIYTIAAGFTTAGTHTVVAAYSGDTNYSAETSRLTLTVGASVSTTGTFTLSSSPSTLSIASGGSGTETISVSPAGGFLGVVNFVATASGSATLNACYALPNATVQAGGGSATMTIFTSISDCSVTGRIPIRSIATKKLAGNSQPSLPKLPRKPAAVLLAGTLLGCFALRRRSRLPLLFILALCAALIPGIGCGSGSSTSPVSGGGGTGTGGGGTTGTNYTITVTGASSTNSSLTASSSFTLNID